MPKEQLIMAILIMALKIVETMSLYISQFIIYLTQSA